MNLDILKQTARELLAHPKGILAADESSPTCAKRFAAANIPCTEETRRTYRELLLTAPGAEAYINGVILHDETIRQKTTDGIPFPSALAKKGIVPGIKVDAGTKEFATGEKITEGLEGLRERLIEYKTLGARFAKWRAVITIGENIPSMACIDANAQALARYAALCQEADIVPIVEPEVLLDGVHTLEQCYEASRATLKAVFSALKQHGAAYEGTILKASMVLSGKDAPTQASPVRDLVSNGASVQEVAEATLRCLKENVPENLAGIVFLSGGQSDERATAHLDAMNKLGNAPWRLTFSYSRALQNPVLKLWAGNQIEKAREAYLFRAKMNSLASEGRYSESLEAGRPY